MEVRSVLVTRDRVRADSACEELRVHGIKCDAWEPTTPGVKTTFSGQSGDIRVVVAPEDEERANKILDAWRPGS
jgi:hypothetical protein